MTVTQPSRDPYDDTRRAAGTGTVGQVFALLFGVAASLSLVVALLAAALGTVVMDPAYPLRGLAVLASHPDVRAAFAESMAEDMDDPQDRDGAAPLDTEAMARDVDALLTDERFLEAMRTARPTGDHWDPADLGRVAAELLEERAATERPPGGMTDAQLRRMADEMRTADAETLDVASWRTAVQRIRLVLWAVAAVTGLVGIGLGAAAVALAGSGRRRTTAGTVALAVGGLGLWCLHPPFALPYLGHLTTATASAAWMLDPVASGLLATLAVAGPGVLAWSRAR